MILKTSFLTVLSAICLQTSAYAGSTSTPSSDSSTTFAYEHKCASVKVKVFALEPSDAQEACIGACDAIAFFASQGITTFDEITIKIKRDLSDVIDRSAAGCFLRAKRSVLILTYSEFRKNKTWFEIPIDHRLYQSLVTHEVAHALASFNFSIASPTIQAEEYIAYVTMFATMEQTQRFQVLSEFPGCGFEAESKISAPAYMLGPMRFGVEAFRHYLKPGNGATFLRAVLSGTALFELGVLLVE